MRFILHFSFHIFVPVILAWIFFRKDWRKAYVIMLLTMLVDLDHLLATPIFDPNRCSVGFHPLHSYIAIGIYTIALVFLPRTYKIIATGLLFHMLTDVLDCHHFFL